MGESRRTYFGLSAYWLATSLKWMILLFLLPTLVKQVVPGGEKNGWWGLIVGIGAAEAMIGPAIMGWLSDRSRSKWGRRRPFVAIGAAMTAISMFVMGQANTVPLLMVAYLLVQISDDIGTGPYSSAIPELVPQSHRGRAAGHMGSLQLLGQLFAVALGLILGSSPMMLFIAIAAINLVCAAISIWSIASLESVSPILEHGPDRKPIPLKSIWEPLKNPDFRWACGTRFLNALGFYIVITYLSNYLDDVVQVFKIGPLEFKEPFEASIAMAAVLSLTGAASAIVNGKRADVVGRKKVVKQAGWVMFAALLAFCFVSSYAALFPLAILFGVGYGAYLSSDWALVSDVIPDRENPARDMGVWQMSVAAPQILSGAIGFLIDQGNLWQMGAGYRVAFLFASVATLLGSLLVVRIKGST